MILAEAVAHKTPSGEVAIVLTMPPVQARLNGEAINLVGVALQSVRILPLFGYSLSEKSPTHDQIDTNAVPPRPLSAVTFAR